ncbi:MAG TPA: ABC transporter permease subunit [Dongiaceae bacterium]|jgi:polar amino acid transport system permease protein/octopine/nopaline transport system permease protein|nr:ABC transporter permease subunit [Dongiaceae bacterium]
MADLLDGLNFLVTVVMPRLLPTIQITLALTFISGVIGLLLSLPVAVARTSHNPALWVPAYCYILLMRGTPLLVQMFFIYYGIGSLLPGTWVRHSWLWPYLRDGFWYAIFALSLNEAGYSGEILRGAIQAVPHGETEAGRAFGMTNWLIFWRITLPRAIRICLPTMTGEIILLLKSTSLASTITVFEIMGEDAYIRSESFRTYSPLLGAAIIYIVLVFLFTRVLYWVERHLNKDRLAPVSVVLPTATH